MRGLKALVVGMGVLLVAGTVTLAVLLVQRLDRGSSPASQDFVLDQPEGSRLLGVAMTEQGRLAVAVQRPDGDRVLLLDLRNGARLSGELRLR